MEKMQFEPGQGSKLPDFRGQTTHRGLRYNSDEDKPKIKKKNLKLVDYFAKASGYQGELEPVEVNGIVVPGFEIFQDMLGDKLLTKEIAKEEDK